MDTGTLILNSDWMKFEKENLNIFCHLKKILSSVSSTLTLTSITIQTPMLLQRIDTVYFGCRCQVWLCQGLYKVFTSCCAVSDWRRKKDFSSFIYLYLAFPHGNGRVRDRVRYQRVGKKWVCAHTRAYAPLHHWLVGLLVRKLVC